jgi:hypothetical protein
MSPFQVVMVFLSHTQISSATCRACAPALRTLAHPDLSAALAPDSPSTAAGHPALHSRAQGPGPPGRGTLAQALRSTPRIARRARRRGPGQAPRLVDEPEVVADQHQAALEALDRVRQRVDALDVLPRARAAVSPGELGQTRGCLRDVCHARPHSPAPPGDFLRDALPRNIQPELPLPMPRASHDVEMQPQAARIANMAKALSKALRNRPGGSLQARGKEGRQPAAHSLTGPPHSQIRTSDTAGGAERVTRRHQPGCKGLRAPAPGGWSAHRAAACWAAPCRSWQTPGAT